MSLWTCWMYFFMNILNVCLYEHVECISLWTCWMYFFMNILDVSLYEYIECMSLNVLSVCLMEFGPDGAFATDLRDDAKATAFLKANGLEDGQFLCCIPRLRFTPYWTIHKERAMDPVKHARNEALKEQDHAPHRQAIIEVLRQTKLAFCITLSLSNWLLPDINLTSNTDPFSQVR